MQSLTFAASLMSSKPNPQPLHLSMWFMKVSARMQVITQLHICQSVSLLNLLSPDLIPYFGIFLQLFQFSIISITLVTSHCNKYTEYFCIYELRLHFHALIKLFLMFLSHQHGCLENPSVFITEFS